MFHIIKDPIKIEPDPEIQIKVIENDESLSDKEKERKIRKIRHKQFKQMMKGKGGIN